MNDKKFTMSVMLSWRGEMNGWQGCTEDAWARHIMGEIAEREILGGNITIESLELLSVVDHPSYEDEDEDNF